MTNRVSFMGQLRGQQLSACLRQHRCMVVPSLCEEGFGIVVLEGIACCKTVIATSRGGLPEALGPCGTTVAPTVAALSAAMLDVALATLGKEPLPGEATPGIRKRHLDMHAPVLVAAKYLNALSRYVPADTGGA
jgi:glycogen(starch) synthase